MSFEFGICRLGLNDFGVFLLCASSMILAVAVVKFIEYLLERGKK